MTKRCLELLRVSTAGQAAEDKVSLPMQRSINRQTAAAFGLTIIRTIEISNVSGAQVLLAPEIQEMLRLMADPEIHGVIVREFSRLMRPENFSDYVMLQAFVETNTILYLPDGPIDFASNDGMLMGTMKAVMGGLERRELVKKMWNSKEEKRRAGGFSQPKSCLPFGVAFDAGQWHYTPEAERVREAFRLVLAGDTSYASMARRVGLDPFSLRIILRNPIYTGWRVIDKRRDPSPAAKKAKPDGRQGDRPKIARRPEDVIRIQVIETPLVPVESFNQAQRILDLKKANHWRTRADVVHRFTYNGYLLCTCERLVYTKYRRDDYYVCSGQCGVGYMRRDRLEPELDRLFTKRLTSPAFLKRHILAPLKRKARPGPNVASLHQQLDSLGNKRQRILDSYFDGLITPDERDTRIAAVDCQHRAVSGILQRNTVRPGLSVETLTETFAPFVEFDWLNREDKRQMLNTITPSIVVANYRIDGLWISLNCSDDLSHTPAAHFEDERLWLPVAA